MSQWYEELFKDYGRKYDDEVFTQGTVGECDFIESEIGGDKSLRILDIGCGTGRHAIELTRRGYHVTGVDLSESQLARAREKAAEAGLAIDFRQDDARSLPYSEEFDLAVMLCEGGFSLMETDEMNFSILQSAARALRPGGKFIFTALNGLFPLFHSVKEFIDAGTDENRSTYGEIAFDLMTFRESGTVNVVDDFGNKKELHTNERYYVPSEITWQLKSLGFPFVEIFGARLGAFSRADRLTTEDYEMLVVALKPKS
jgi:SAM-dependent methyltransferase